MTTSAHMDIPKNSILTFPKLKIVRIQKLEQTQRDSKRWEPRSTVGGEEQLRCLGRSQDLAERKKERKEKWHLLKNFFLSSRYPHCSSYPSTQPPEASWVNECLLLSSFESGYLSSGRVTFREGKSPTSRSLPHCSNHKTDKITFLSNPTD